MCISPGPNIEEAYSTILHRPPKKKNVYHH